LTSRGIMRKSYHPDSANMSGITVKITGVVSMAKLHGMKEDTKAEMKEHGMDKHATERGHI
jgi:hypothetical protein